MSRAHPSDGLNDSDNLADVHFRFLEARKLRHTTGKAADKAKSEFELRRRELDAAHVQISQLRALRRRDQLTEDSFKKFDEAQKHLREKQDRLNDSEILSMRADTDHEVATIKLVVAKRYCLKLSCQELHEEAHDEKEYIRDKERRWKNKERQASQKGAGGGPSSRTRTAFEEFMSDIPFTTTARSADPPIEPSANPNNPATPQHQQSTETIQKNSKSASQWLEEAQEAFKDYTSIANFPDPPAKRCDELACIRSVTSRSLKACPCYIRKCLNNASEEQLKKLRLGFHPDRYERCAENVREGFKRKAQEVFVVVESVYREKKR